MFLHESKMFVEATTIEAAILEHEHKPGYTALRKHLLTWKTCVRGNNVACG